MAAIAFGLIAAVFAAMTVGAAAQKLPPVDDAAYPKVIASHKGKVVLVDFWQMH